ncbi:MAG: hypothetical protein K2N72_13310 [Oscillospiraceae bacterium]|nr:hypothetical protein [Oscillospiraceae bacterium]
MNKNKLKEILAKNKIPEWYYNVDESGETDDRICMVQENNKWKVYYTERGKQYDVIFLNSESEACEEILKRFDISGI